MKARARVANYQVIAWLWIVTAAVACGQEPATWRVLIEPKFMRAAVTAPIAGAVRAQWTAATVSNEGPSYVSRSQFDAWKINWEKFFEQARLNAAVDLADAQIEFVRNSRQVIEYARLSSPRGLASSATLAPGFRAAFENTLGAKLLVAVPNRFTAYIFPGLAGNFQNYAFMIYDGYRATPYPVSIELFELSSAGFKAVGTYEEQ